LNFGSGCVIKNEAVSRNKAMIRQLRQVSVKTKILQFALILIILPSGILGYFGFRAIENRGFRL
jgi:hypothetical protein